MTRDKNKVDCSYGSHASNGYYLRKSHLLLKEIGMKKDFSDNNYKLIDYLREILDGRCLTFSITIKL